MSRLPVVRARPDLEPAVAPLVPDRREQHAPVLPDRRQHGDDRLLQEAVEVLDREIRAHGRTIPVARSGGTARSRSRPGARRSGRGAWWPTPARARPRLTAPYVWNDDADSFRLDRASPVPEDPPVQEEDAGRVRPVVPRLARQVADRVAVEPRLRVADDQLVVGLEEVGAAHGGWSRAPLRRCRHEREAVDLVPRHLVAEHVDRLPDVGHREPRPPAQVLHRRRPVAGEVASGPARRRPRPDRAGGGLAGHPFIEQRVRLLLPLPPAAADQPDELGSASGGTACADRRDRASADRTRRRARRA